MRMKSDKMPFLIGIITIVAFILGNAVMAIANGGNNNGGGEPDKPQIDEMEHVETETEKKIIAFETQTVNDDTIEYGKTVVKTEGVNGERTYTYRVTYKGKKEVSREPVEDKITKQPVTKIIANGTKIVWHCKDTTSYDGYSGNDNLCTSSTGEQRYVGDCAAVALDPSYHPSQRGAPRYNGCPNY